MLACRIVFPILLIIATTGATATAAPASGARFRMWPLFDYEKTTDGWALDMLGPILAIKASSDGTKVIVRPLASFSSSGDERRLTVLYPLLTLRWSPVQTRARILGFGAIDRRTAEPSAEWRDYVRLPPLLYYRADPARRTSIAMLPLYADLADTLGQHRIRVVAFPLFMRIEPDPGGASRTWAPFPFLSISRGPTTRGFGLWPLLGWYEGDSERSAYALWPLYIRSVESRADGETEERLTLGPLYWQTDSPSRWSRGYFGFGYTVDDERGDERWDFPWPVWHFDRGPDHTRISVRPFYVHSRTPTISTGNVLWPVYGWQTQIVDGDRYAHRELLLGLWQWTSRQNTDGESSRLHTAFPLFRHSRRGSSHTFATPALVDALFPTNLQVRELYAPLWQVFASRRQGERRRWKLLWGMLAGDGKRLQYPLEWRFDEGPNDGG